MAPTAERKLEGSSPHKNATVKGHEQLVNKVRKTSLSCKPITKTKSNAGFPLGHALTPRGEWERVGLTGLQRRSSQQSACCVQARGPRSIPKMHMLRARESGASLQAQCCGSKDNASLGLPGQPAWPSWQAAG